MNVWIVRRIDCEDTEIMGVFADERIANAMLDEYAAKDKQDGHRSGWSVACYEVETEIMNASL